jgi:hypothetical protein
MRKMRSFSGAPHAFAFPLVMMRTALGISDASFPSASCRRKD